MDGTASNSVKASIAAKIFAWVMLFSGFGLLPLIALAYRYYWSKAPAIPVILGSVVLLLWNWRSARYFRAVSPLVASQPVRFGTDFAVVPTPITRIFLRHVVEIATWYCGIAFIYWEFDAEFALPSSVEDPWIVVGGFIAFFLAVLTLNPALLWTLGTVTALVRAIVDLRRLRARVVSLLVAYVVVDLCFAALYQLLAVHSREAFRPPITTFLDSLYFSTMTLATVGYGDFVPANSFTKTLAITEVFFGIALLVVLLAAAMSTPDSQHRV